MPQIYVKYLKTLGHKFVEMKTSSVVQSVQLRNLDLFALADSSKKESYPAGF